MLFKNQAFYMSPPVEYDLSCTPSTSVPTLDLRNHPCYILTNAAVTETVLFVLSVLYPILYHTTIVHDLPSTLFVSPSPSQSTSSTLQQCNNVSPV